MTGRGNETSVVSAVPCIRWALFPATGAWGDATIGCWVKGVDIFRRQTPCIDQAFSNVINKQKGNMHMQFAFLVLCILFLKSLQLF